MPARTDADACGNSRRQPVAGARSLTMTVALAALSLLAACTGTSAAQVDTVDVEKNSAATTTTLPPDCAEVLPPSAQAGQMIMVMVTSPQLATDVLTAGQAGGFGLKGRQSSDVGAEVAGAIATAPIAPFVASDEEGGSVQRLSSAIDDLPSAQEMAEGTPEDAASTMSTYAKSMRELGFNMNFGPVADVGNGAGLGDRSFGDDPAVVTGFSDAIIGAQQEAGLISVVKHWPGIGSGIADPHDALGAVDPIDQLRIKDLIPFDSAIAAGVPAIMVSHVEVPGLTAEGVAASLSREAITGELRDRQGFTGLVITDSLGMNAIVDEYPQPQAAEMAIAAGADIALVSGADVVPGTYAQLTEAITSGRLPAEQVIGSVRRILASKGITGDCPDLAARLATLEQDAASTSLPTGDGDVDSGINSGESDSSSDSDDSSSGTGSGSGTGSSSKSSTTTVKAAVTTTTAKKSTTTAAPTTTMATTTTQATTTTSADEDPGAADVVSPGE